MVPRRVVSPFSEVLSEILLLASGAGRGFLHLLSVHGRSRCYVIWYYNSQHFCAMIIPMSREPLTAADRITFLDKVECDLCEYRTTEEKMDEHYKLVHLRREVEEASPWVKDDSGAWVREVDSLSKQTAKAYDRSIYDRLSQSAAAPPLSTGTQSVSTEYADLKKEVEKLKQQQNVAAEKRKIEREREAFEKEEYLRDLRHKIDKAYMPGHQTGDFLRQQVRLYEVGAISNRSLRERLGSVIMD